MNGLSAAENVAFAYLVANQKLLRLVRAARDAQRYAMEHPTPEALHMGQLLTVALAECRAIQAASISALPTA